MANIEKSLVSDKKGQSNGGWPNFLSALGIIAIFILLLFYPSRGSNLRNSENVVFVSDKEKSVSLKDFNDTSNFLEGEGLQLAIDTDIKGINFVALYSVDGNVYFSTDDGRYLIRGDVIDVKEGILINEAYKAKVLFSSLHSNDISIESTHKKINAPERNSSAEIDLDMQTFEQAMSEKLNQIPVAKKVVTNELVSTSNNQTPVTVANKECLITFGGFNQPKMGFDDKCNPLTEIEKQQQIQILINGFPDEFFIRFPAENEVSEIYVFTDYTCTYCQKLHRNIDGFLNNGVSVNYIFHPRAVGVQGNDIIAEKIVNNMSSVWCSENQQEATHSLFKNKSHEFTRCDKNDTKLDSPVRQHYILGMMFDISGTPLIVGSNGKTTYGFRSVGTTLSRLQL